MLVMHWMTKPAVTVDQNNSLIDAMEILKQKDIMILPVMKRYELVGIVSDRDVKRAFASNVIPLEIHELFYLSSSPDSRQILSHALATVMKDFDLEAGRIYLMEEDGRHLFLAAHSGIETSGLEKIDLDSGFSGKAARTRSFIAQYVTDRALRLYIWNLFRTVS